MESQRDPRSPDLAPWSPAVPRVRDAPLATGNMPTGIAVAIGAVTVVVAVMAAAFLPASAAAARLSVLAVALGTFAAATVNPTAVAAVTVLGWLMFDGFLVNRFGELTWTGRVDERRLAVVVAAALVGLAAGGLWRWAEARRRDAEFEGLATGAADSEIGLTEGEGHDAGPGVRAGDDRVVSGAGVDGAGGEQAVRPTSRGSEPGSREREVTR